VAALEMKELPSKGTRPITRRPLAVGVDFFQGSSTHGALPCPIWGKGLHLSAGIGRFNRILPSEPRRRFLGPSSRFHRTPSSIVGSMETCPGRRE
jgi:hypothetical protein